MSDRQLNQFAYHQLRVDRGRLLSAGYLWEYAPGTFIIQAGQSGVMSFVTGIAPVLWSSAKVLSTSVTPGSGDGWTRIETYAGGTITGGETRTGLPLNHNRPQPSPLAQFDFDVNIDVPGTLISQTVVAPGGAIQGDDIMVLAENQQYYITFENVVPPSVSFSGPWRYQLNNSDPQVGDANHSTNGQLIKFSFEDANTTDRTADLTGVQIGTFILRDDGTSWQVTSANLGLSAEFGVTPGNSAPPDQTYDFEFQISVPGDSYMSVELEFGALPPSDIF